MDKCLNRMAVQKRLRRPCPAAPRTGQAKPLPKTAYSQPKMQINHSARRQPKHAAAAAHRPENRQRRQPLTDCQSAVGFYTICILAIGHRDVTIGVFGRIVKTKGTWMLSHTELSQMLETAVVAARLAGQRAMEELRYVARTIKNGSELVTQADPICQKIIIDRIRENYPDHGFLGEEGSNGTPLKWAPRGSDAIWWIIDPIDGTNNYASGLLCFSVSIAALYQGRPVIGVIFDPCTDSMFTAVEGGDAQLNTVRITVNDDGISKFSSFGTDSNVHSCLNRGVHTMMERGRIRVLGSTALHLAYVARGGLIGSVTVFSKLWDIAAGALLVERAGGKLSDLSGNPVFPVDVENYDGRECPLLTSNPKNYSELLTIFKP